jgi:hypothetical protein
MSVQLGLHCQQSFAGLFVRQRPQSINCRIVEQTVKPGVQYGLKQEFIACFRKEGKRCMQLFSARLAENSASV